MIWQERCGVIVMLTLPEEGNKVNTITFTFQKHESSLELLQQINYILFMSCCVVHRTSAVSIGQIVVLF
jgi:hypothetical protein